MADICKSNRIDNTLRNTKPDNLDCSRGYRDRFFPAEQTKNPGREVAEAQRVTESFRSKIERKL